MAEERLNEGETAEETGRQRWRRGYEQAAKREADFTTLSGLDVEVG